MIGIIRRCVITALVVATVSASGTSIAQMPDQREPPLLYYCMLPFGYLIDAVSQWKHDRETVKVTVLSRELTFRKNRLYYYPPASATEARMVEFGEIVRGCELPVGDRTVSFARGEIKFYRSGAVMYGTLARSAEFTVNGVTLPLAPERAGFHENGALMYGSLRGRTKFNIGGIEYAFGPGQAEFYPSGQLKTGKATGKQVLKNGTREIKTGGGYYAEFDSGGNLKKLTVPAGADSGAVRIPVGGRTLDFQYASFHSNLSIITGRLSAPAKIMTGSGEFTFAAEDLFFHESGVLKSGILPGGVPLQVKGGAVTPDKDVNAVFRGDGTLEKIFFPDVPFRRDGRITWDAAGENRVCNYVVFDPRGWISEAYLESPAAFMAGGQTVRVRGKAVFHPGGSLLHGTLLGEQLLLVGGRRKLCGGGIELTESGNVSRCESMRSAK